MRIMPFMKRKKGLQFAGIGLDTGGGGSSSLPIASADTLGGVKIGTGIEVASDGTISSAGGITFSTEEIESGQKWVDGKKIYCRVYQFYVKNGITSIPAPTFENLIDIKGIIKASDNNFFPINYYYGQQHVATDIRYSIDGLKIYVQLDSVSPNDVPASITLYYTKGE